VVRELLKCMDGVTRCDYHELLQIIKLLIEKEALEFKIEPKIDYEMNWNLLIFSSSNWAIIQ
jgi:hypothetical protein